MKRMMSLLLSSALALALLTSCAASAEQEPTPVLDDRLFGQWTTTADRTPVEIDAKGQPVGSFPIGVWFEFRSDGTYFSAANHMTFAIGGISVEEGRYEVKDGALRLYRRTWSFFPFEGSPQKKQYRTSQPDAALDFAAGTDGEVRTLSLGEAGADLVVFRETA